MPAARHANTVRAALLALLAVGSVPALAQSAGASAPAVTQQRGGTYVEPPARVDPVYVPLGPNQPGEAPWQEPRVSLRFTLEAPLRHAPAAGAATQGTRPGSTTVQAALRWRPFEDRAWFVQGTAFGYVDRAQQRSWDPDFTYAFGYDDGRPGHWAFTYANYTGTRVAPDAARGEGRWNFPQGQWTASYRFDLPQAWKNVLLAGDGDTAPCHADANLVSRFSRSTGGFGSDKSSFGLGCRYTRPEGWFAHATALAWPDRPRQQPWDPDFVYGFGWTQPGPGGLTLQYANYSGNRWPGRARSTGEGLFRSGSVSLGWGTAW
jgi:hypothetical protein